MCRAPRAHRVLRRSRRRSRSRVCCATCARCSASSAACCTRCTLLTPTSSSSCISRSALHCCSSFCFVRGGESQGECSGNDNNSLLSFLSPQFPPPCPHFIFGCSERQQPNSACSSPFSPSSVPLPFSVWVSRPRKLP